MSGKATKLPPGKEQKQTAFRLPTDLIDRIEAYRVEMEKRVPGIRLTTADAVRALLSLALDGMEGKRGRGR